MIDIDKCRLQYVKEETFKRESLKQPIDMYNFCKEELHLHEESEEVMVLMVFDNKLQNISCFEVARGGKNGASVCPSDIFKRVLLVNGCGVALAHNHPSDNIKPSSQDYSFTNEIKKICEFFTIRFIDHIIVGTNEYYSFHEKDVLDDEGVINNV